MSIDVSFSPHSISELSEFTPHIVEDKNGSTRLAVQTLRIESNGKIKSFDEKKAKSRVQS